EAEEEKQFEEGPAGRPGGRAEEWRRRGDAEAGAPMEFAESGLLMEQQDFQLKWPDAELSRIGNRVQQDYRNAISDHNKRMSMWRDYYRRWRARPDAPA